VILTDWECQRTQTQYDNSMALKLYFLQFVNYYSSLCYIAFFNGRLVRPVISVSLDRPSQSAGYNPPRP